MWPLYRQVQSSTTLQGKTMLAVTVTCSSRLTHVIYGINLSKTIITGRLSEILLTHVTFTILSSHIFSSNEITSDG
jgi:hypothetical protein